MVKSQILFDYLQDRYQTKPETLFAKHPDYAVFRHYRSRKWFALFMPVSAKKLGLASDEVLNILNLKLEPQFIDVLRQQKGYYPAYHMNKEHWISIDLAMIEQLDELVPLIEDSHRLTK
ncbi:MmcQ/YjbR family DNA-binding protein [Gallibacterium salpingitidis]|uniref:MmcQ/YjbR family DNA-binding protein n=1 Tax=Gallibacterium salpingitidis TaxID=505341 RepID=UPI0026707637|nr:MmcQ/YjbR family DNA-binding protein [Gallibacterium salpingitidis]WKS98673.1 MmcQ/YjbR family DNA-binding protein [Gallibacterium salpingitidis]